MLYCIELNCILRSSLFPEALSKCLWGCVLPGSVHLKSGQVMVRHSWILGCPLAKVTYYVPFVLFCSVVYLSFFFGLTTSIQGRKLCLPSLLHTHQSAESHLFMFQEWKKSVLNKSIILLQVNGWVLCWDGITKHLIEADEPQILEIYQKSFGLLIQICTSSMHTQAHLALCARGEFTFIRVSKPLHFL